MPLYEHVFLARQDISAQQVEALVESFRSILEEHGGSVGKTEYWGLQVPRPTASRKIARLITR